jgi:hypothetical protein
MRTTSGLRIDSLCDCLYSALAISFDENVALSVAQQIHRVCADVREDEFRAHEADAVERQVFVSSYYFGVAEVHVYLGASYRCVFSCGCAILRRQLLRPGTVCRCRMRG